MSDRTKGELDETKSEAINSHEDVSNICVVGLMLHSRMTYNSYIAFRRSQTRRMPTVNTQRNRMLK